MKLASSSSKNFKRFWFLTIDKDIDDWAKKKNVLLGANIGHVTENTIEAALNDPKGWRKHGYIFEKVSVAKGLSARQKSEKNWKNYIHVHLSTEKTISMVCGFTNLSCADLQKNLIFFNIDRWVFGSKESGLNLDAYRFYVTSHEFGHALARDHNTCNKDVMEPCPIMYQQTISKGCCVPNIYPLNWE